MCFPKCPFSISPRVLVSWVLVSIVDEVNTKKSGLQVQTFFFHLLSFVQCCWLALVYSNVSSSWKSTLKNSKILGSYILTAEVNQKKS
jgi:hypothetical protein